MASVPNLRRLADCVAQGDRLPDSITGERIVVRAHATIRVEHERGGDVEEIGFQIALSLRR